MEIVRTRREVTETTEEDEDCQVLEAEQPGEVDAAAGSDERGRQLNRKTVTTTVRVTKRSTSRKRVKNKKQSDKDNCTLLLSPETDESVDRLISPLLTSTPLKTNGFHHDYDGGGLLQKAPKSRQSCGKIGRISFLEPDSPPSPTAEDPRIGHLLLGGKGDAPPPPRPSSVTPTNPEAPCKNCRGPERKVDLRIIGDDSTNGDVRAGAEVTTSYDIEDFPVNLIVTHIAGEEADASGRPRRKCGRNSISGEKKRLLLDSWNVQVNQVCRWSELRNDRNVEIDGISRLKVYKDGFSFESSVLELWKAQ